MLKVSDIGEKIARKSIHENILNIEFLQDRNSLPEALFNIFGSSSNKQVLPIF